MPVEHALFARLRALAAAAPVVVAHRGDSGGYPENTLAAFNAGIAAGAPMTEFDTHETRDGTIVCIHDETLDRTTDAIEKLGRTGVEVASLDAAALAKFDAGKWKGAKHKGAHVPTLAEVLATLRGHSIPMIEVKAGDAANLVQLLRQLDLVEEVLVQSFDWSLVAQVGQLEPRIARGALGEGPFTEHHWRDLTATGAGLVHWDVRAIRAEDIARLHGAGYLTCVYTANDDVSMAGAAALGIDAITTNHPKRLVELIAQGHARRR